MSLRSRIFSAFILYFLIKLVVAQEPWCATASEDVQRWVEQRNSLHIIEPRTELGCIPVVFHLVLHEEAMNSVSFSMLQAQIDALNRDFLTQLDQEKFPRFGEDIGTVDWCFEIATSENGEPLVLYKEAPYEGFGLEFNLQGQLKVKYDLFGGSDALDSDYFLNIWIVDIPNNIIGFSTFPGNLNKQESGICLDYTVLPESESQVYDLGRTLVHEIGHYFGLLHPDGDRENCLGDDGVADTPVQSVKYYDCVNDGKSCGSYDMIQNFMQYTADDCLNYFSQGQVELMHQVRAQFYPNLSTDQSVRDTPRILVRMGRVLFINLEMLDDSRCVEIYNSSGTLVEHQCVEGSDKFLVYDGFKLTNGLYFIVNDKGKFLGRFLRY